MAFSLSKVLEYLSSAKEMLHTEAPNVLERVSEIAALVAAAAKEAKDWFANLNLDGESKTETPEMESQHEEPMEGDVVAANRSKQSKQQAGNMGEEGESSESEVPNKDQFESIKASFHQFHDEMSEYSNTPATAIRMAQMGKKKGSKAVNMLPPSITSILAKLIFVAVDKIIDHVEEVDESELPK